MRLKNEQLGILICIIFVLTISTIYTQNLTNNDEVFESINIDNNLKTAGYWNFKYLHIDDSGMSGNGTWSYISSTYAWCTGAGTWNSPYVLENITIDGGGTGDCILIGNSSVYFIIRNCTLYNSQLSTLYGALRLENVDNGKIIDNDFSNGGGYYGIRSDNVCDNNTISNNRFCNHLQSGIRMRYSSFNIIFNNSFISNAYAGMEIRSYSNNNTIINNTLTGPNQGRGIYIYYYCNNNTVSNNTVYNHANQGIGVASYSNYNTISNNNISILTETTTWGLGLHVVTTCSYNTFTGNTVSKCNNRGLTVTGCTWNTFYNNYFINNSNQVWASTSLNYWDNGVIGNYWDDYTGVDANDDGIGDTPYVCSLCTDNYPIWDDGPQEMYSLHIDDSGTSGNGTWAWAKSNNLCSGYGSKDNPYQIKNKIIDAGGIGDGILIGNSSVYFIIKNCTVINTQSGGNYSAIRLHDVDNGLLFKNNCSNTPNIGIRLEVGCLNNTISNNTVCKNGGSGIVLSAFCNYNTISNNTAYDNNPIGIEIVIKCSHNNITNNDASDTLSGYVQAKGINLWKGCSYNTISNNIIANNTSWGLGIQADGGTDPSNHNSISRNTIINDDFGIYNQYCSYNNFTENYIINNYNYGIYLSGTTSQNNTVYNNTFINNGVNAHNDHSSNKWDNGIIGNYWDDYTGKDVNDDGIGDSNYNTSGSTVGTDHFPIWWDSIVFTVYEPYNTTTYTELPNYNITIQEGVRHTSWYCINYSGSWSQNYTFTSLTGKINSSLWVSIPNGSSIIIRFFVNDSRGEITYLDIFIIRNVSEGDQVDDDDDGDNEIQDNSIIIIIIAATGVAFGLGGSVTYKKRKSRSRERIKESSETVKDKRKETADEKVKDEKRQVKDKIMDAKEQKVEKTKGALPKEKAFNSLIKKTKKLSEEALNAKEKANFEKAQKKWAESLNLITQARSMAMDLKPELVAGIDKVIKTLNENIQNLGIEKEYSSAIERIEIANGQMQRKNFDGAIKDLKRAKIRLVKSVDIATQLKVEPFVKILNEVQSNVEEAINNYNLGKLDLLTPIAIVPIGTGDTKQEYKSVEDIEPLVISEIEAKTPTQPGLMLKAKPKKVHKAEAPPLELTKQEKKELQKTEEEVSVKREEFICVVHKGTIRGDDIYLCPYCHTLYCTKCAKALKEKGETCWTCGKEITVTSMIRMESKTQQKIQDLEEKLDVLKNTIKMLDDNFYTGAIDEAEYDAMKAPAMKKIAGIMTKIKKLKVKSTSKQKYTHLEVSRGGDWKNEGNQSVFYYKVKVKNMSEYLITNVQILLTSIPAGLEVKSDRYKIENLKPDTYESPTFKLIAKESCVGNILEGIVTYTDPKGRTNSIQIRPFEIKYVCNLLVPKQISKEEFTKKTSDMEIKVLSIESNVPLSDLEEKIKPIVTDCNFALMPREGIQSDEIRIIEGFAEGLYDKEEVAFSIELTKESDDATKVNIKAMSNKIDKLTDIIRDFSFKLDDIKSDTQIIKDYTSQIEDIFDKAEDIEQILKDSLGSDFTQIKNIWQDFKDGKIGRKDFITQSLKKIGKKFAKSIIHKFI